MVWWSTPEFRLVFGLVCAVIVFFGVCLACVPLYHARNGPAQQPVGWPGKQNSNYDADQCKRKSLKDYMSVNKIPDTTPMNQLSVATASFGGIYTEDNTGLNPWLGTVDPNAAQSQVEAGARAFVADIWPDPNTRAPVVCSMIDNQSTPQSRWINWGLGKGVGGRYSNWHKVTRNMAPASSILQAALKAAFMSGTGTQNEDPFFLILRIHGSMSVDYLNNLGDIVRDAIGGRAMGAEWNRCMNQKSICTAPISQFMSRVFLLVLPDIATNAYAAFTQKFLGSRLGEATNAVEQIPNTMYFDPNNISTISAPSQPPCGGGTPLQPVTAIQQSLAQTGFCVVQPSTGQSTLNKDLYASPSYADCLASGAQFVAVNLFSTDSPDSNSVLGTFFDAGHYGSYSFRKI